MNRWSRRSVLRHVGAAFTVGAGVHWASLGRVAELSEPFAMSQPAISKHLKVLEGAGLIVRDRDAQRRPSRLNAGPLVQATQWLADYRQFWKSSLHKLDDVLEDLKTKKKKGKKRKHKKH